MSAVVERLPDRSIEIRFTYRRDVVEALKLHISADCRSWDPDWKVWTVRPPYTDTAINILGRAFGFDGVEIVDRHQAEPEPTLPARVDPVFATLWVLPGAPPAVITAAYRALARELHPDAGGDTRAMQKVNAAFEELQARGVVGGRR
jgi:hypothetical protein